MHSQVLLILHCKPCFELMLLIIDALLVLSVLLLHLEFCNFLLCKFEFPFQGMLLSKLFILFSLSLKHGSLSILLGSLERLMFLLVMCFDAMLFPFKSMLDLRLTLVQRHGMMMRWLVQFSDQSDFLFLVMVRFGRLSSDLYLNLVLLGLSVDSWLMVWLRLRSFMVVDVRLDVSNSMVNYVGFCHSLLFRRSRVHIVHRDRCQYKRLIYHLKLGMMDHRL